MCNKTDRRQSGIKRYVIHIYILLALALGIGVYLIITTVIIAKDGVKYIEYAQKFENATIEIMLEQDYHPGYPVILLGVHKTMSLFRDKGSVFGWIYSAQSAALLFRLLSIGVLYFIGKELVGPVSSFWAVLIIVLLPLPARYGSNALSDWPHLFFLTTGFFLAVRAAISGKLHLFALAGLTAGVGYLVRPECAQVVIYGLLWLMLDLVVRKTSNWPKTVFAAVLLLVGFLLVAAPYMKLKGALFPKKNLGRFALQAQSRDSSENQTQQRPSTLDTPDVAGPGTVKALVKLVGNVGDTLEWVFVPAWIVGLYISFRKTSLYKARQFFVTALVVINVVLMIWLYIKHGYMDKRHTLPLVLFTIYYVPGGLEVMASWLQKVKTRNIKRQVNNKQLVFCVLLAIGIGVCIPQLLRPLNHEKLFLRKAAQWLIENTDKNDIVATSDARIAFYAERSRMDYDENANQKAAKYAVAVIKKKDIGSDNVKKHRRSVVFSMESEDKKARVVIYGKPR